MPIGAYNPWIHNHCTPEQAVTMADAAGARLDRPRAPSVVPAEQRAAHELIERMQEALVEELDRLAMTAIQQQIVLLHDDWPGLVGQRR